MTVGTGIVLFGDVVSSRAAPGRATRWLQSLSHTLDDDYGPGRLASFEFTQGDEIQGLLRPGADPFHAVLSSALRPTAGHDAAPRMRWVMVYGDVDDGSGPATHRTGAAFVRARDVLDAARDERDLLRCESGDPVMDAYLDGTAPVLAAIIERMTDRQRQVARLAILEGLRRSEIADRLEVTRPTISVSYARGDVRNLERLITVVRAMWTDGVARMTAA